MIPELLLILGPPGTGKTTVIERLRALDARFVYISPYTTRDLRPNEVDKISISDAEMENMNANGEFIIVNELYGVKYGTPRRPIVDALAEGRFPVIDWPISRVALMMAEFPTKTFRVYLRPPTADILASRLVARETQDVEIRLSAAKCEMEQLERGEFRNLIDLVLINETGRQADIAALIREHYLKGACATNGRRRVQMG